MQGMPGCALSWRGWRVRLQQVCGGRGSGSRVIAGWVRVTSRRGDVWLHNAVGQGHGLEWSPNRMQQAQGRESSGSKQEVLCCKGTLLGAACKRCKELPPPQLAEVAPRRPPPPLGAPLKHKRHRVNAGRVPACGACRGSRRRATGRGASARCGCCLVCGRRRSERRELLNQGIEALGEARSLYLRAHMGGKGGTEVAATRCACMGGAVCMQTGCGFGGCRATARLDASANLHNGHSPPEGHVQTTPPPTVSSPASAHAAPRTAAHLRGSDLERPGRALVLDCPANQPLERAIVPQAVHAHLGVRGDLPPAAACRVDG